MLKNYFQIYPLIQIIYRGFPVEKLKLLQDAINSFVKMKEQKQNLKLRRLMNKFNALYPEKEIKQFNKEFDAQKLFIKA